MTGPVEKLFREINRIGNSEDHAALALAAERATVKIETIQALWEAINTLDLLSHFIMPRERKMGEACTERENLDATRETVMAAIQSLASAGFEVDTI